MFCFSFYTYVFCIFLAFLKGLLGIVLYFLEVSGRQIEATWGIAFF